MYGAYSNRIEDMHPKSFETQQALEKLVPRCTTRPLATRRGNNGSLVRQTTLLEWRAQPHLVRV
jgi:hypothetical protein